MKTTIKVLTYVMCIAIGALLGQFIMVGQMAVYSREDSAKQQYDAGYYRGYNDCVMAIDSLSGYNKRFKR